MDVHAHIYTDVYLDIDVGAYTHMYMYVCICTYAYRCIYINAHVHAPMCEEPADSKAYLLNRYGVLLGKLHLVSLVVG